MSTTRRKRRSALQGREPGFIYSRFANPTVDMFEKRMCALEGAEDARATASGMAAVTAALLCSVKAGDHVVAARALFGSCRWVVETLMPKYGIETTLVDGTKIDQWQAAVRPEHQAVLPRKPDQSDAGSDRHRGVAKIANSIGARARGRQCVRHAAAAEAAGARRHVVVYSATKHIDGQGRCLGGIVLSDKEWIDKNLHDFFRHTGPACRRSTPGRC
jgi:O-succinylhomoserine sulfhydrylase